MVRLAAIGFGGALVALLLVVGAGYWALDQYERPGPLTTETVVVIPSGASISVIAMLLKDSGVIREPLLLRLGAQYEGADNALQAGEYAFPARVSTQEAVEILRSGRTVTRRVTIPEGLTVKQVMAILDETDALDGEIKSLPAEGSLLPETYYISLGDTRESLIARMRAAMDAAVAEAWATRAPDLPLASPEEAVILASIVQKEAGHAGEAARIAGVFINRLRIDMPLQADPTVVYAVSDGAGRLGRRLTRSDLQVDSLYNTYKHNGLPPGPITNPGREALRAATQPDKTEDLYFVADGTGGHAFAKTLEEHNRNVARWRKFLRKRRANGG